MTNDAIAEALRSLRLKFTSGNDVPVPEARITRAEWEAIDQSHAAEAAQAQAQSDEWVMVPREPTEWMLQAAEDAVNAAAHCESTTDDLSAIAYKAALAAAPQPPAARVTDAIVRRMVAEYDAVLCGDPTATRTDGMRAALEAALAAQESLNG